MQYGKRKNSSLYLTSNASMSSSSCLPLSVPLATCFLRDLISSERTLLRALLASNFPFSLPCSSSNAFSSPLTLCHQNHNNVDQMCTALLFTVNDNMKQVSSNFKNINFNGIVTMEVNKFKVFFLIQDKLLVLKGSPYKAVKERLFGDEHTICEYFMDG